MRSRILVAGLAVLAVAAAVVVTRPAVYRAASDSMSPTVRTGDLLVTTAAPTAPRRGDVVVFSDPGAWASASSRLTGSPVEGPFVKRVIGLPGERVACCDGDGRITVDGRALDEPYLPTGTGLASVLAFDEVVGLDAVYVLGDNRGGSIDSRYLGTVPFARVIAVDPWVVPLSR